MVSLSSTIIPLLFSVLSIVEKNSEPTNIMAPLDLYLILLINVIPQLEMSFGLWHDECINGMLFWIEKLICPLSSSLISLYCLFGFFRCIYLTATKIIFWDWVALGMLSIPTVFALIELVLFIIGDGKSNITTEKKTLTEKIELNKMNHI